MTFIEFFQVRYEFFEADRLQNSLLVVDLVAVREKRKKIFEHIKLRFTMIDVKIFMKNR